jgi:hypothetical protein
MSNKPHRRPHQRERRASRVTRLVVATLIITFMALGIVLSASGHIPPGFRVP